MKKQSSQAPLPQKNWNGRAHLKTCVAALVVWLGLFVIVLLEHGRSWARLLPLLFVFIVLYGVYGTWVLIRENNNQRYK